MKTKEQNREEIKIKRVQLLVANILIVLLVIFSITFLIYNQQHYQENSVLKAIMIADNKFAENLLIEKTAEEYYDLAGLDYEKEDYSSVEYNCKLARKYYSESSQGYKNIKAELISKEINHKLINIYISMFEELIITQNNMYESCEHFEAASRYYNLDNYYMGGEEIDSMNEKIRSHDIAIERYNNLLAEYNLELNNID